jgi:abortive infection bacteriophage resistance protein
MNHVRNACAHNKRLWNRVLTVKPALQPKDLPSELAHLAGISNDKPYPIIAITAYLTKKLCSDAEWAESARAIINAFPVIPRRSIAEMGVPPNWADETIWK